MKIETQLQEDHQAKLVVEVEAETMEMMKHRAARKIARRVKIPGFRPGKAPYPVILRQVGEGPITEEALEMLVEDIYPKVIEEAEIKPYGPGSLENVESVDPPILEFIVPLDAEVTLGDYRSLRRPYEIVPVSDSDVDKVVQNLLERQAIVEPAERPTQEGDIATIRIRATGASAEEGEEDKELMDERSIPILILPSDESDEDSPFDNGEGSEWPFKGFSQSLIGLSEGDEEKVQHLFPEDSPAEAFQGSEVVFHITVEAVKARTLPALDDEFASSMGDYEDLEALNAAIRSTLEAQTLSEYNKTYDEEILEAATEQTTYKYPPQMLENEIDEVIRDFTRRLEGQKLDLDLYLKTRDLDMKGFRDELVPVAENRIKRALFLFEIAQAEDIEVEQEDVESEARNTVEYLSQTLPKKESRRLSDKNVYGNLIGSIMADMLSRQAMERLREICKGNLVEEASEEEEQVDEVSEDIPPEAELEPVQETVDDDSPSTTTEIVDEVTNAPIEESSEPNITEEPK